MIFDDKPMIKSNNKPYDKTWINLWHLDTNKPFKTLKNIIIKYLTKKSYDNKL